MQPGKDAALSDEASGPRSSKACQTEGSVTPAIVCALVLAQCFFGLSPVISRAWVSEGEGVSYPVFLAYRCVVGSITLYIGARVIEGEGPGPPRHISPQEFFALSGLGIISSLTFLFAIGLIGSFLPALGETLIPVYVCAICVACGLETVRRTKIMGIAIAVSGALLIVAREESRKNSPGHYQEVIATPRPHHLAVLVMRHVTTMYANHPSATSKGLALIVVHIIAAGSYWTLKKQLLYRAQPLHLSAFANMLSATLAFAVACWHFGSGMWIPTTKNMLALGFSTFESVFGTGLTAWAVKRTKATSVVASMTLQPLFSSFFGWVMFGSRLQADHALGMLLTTCGLLLVVYAQSVEGEEDTQKATEAKRSSMKLLQP
jgi:drug/metabolite transporter (DMT)-like permease